MCRGEWDNPAASDHGRRLIVEWTADLLGARHRTGLRSTALIQWPQAGHLDGRVPGAVHLTGDECRRNVGTVGVDPPALQLPAEAHDTDKASAGPPWSRAAVPGTSRAVPQVPPAAAAAPMAPVTTSAPTAAATLIAAERRASCVIAHPGG